MTSAKCYVLSPVTGGIAQDERYFFKGIPKSPAKSRQYKCT
jgi:hypothetical protein